VRNDVTPSRKFIYFHLNNEFLAKLKKYCEAFYLGMTVKIIYPQKAKTSE
jgi:hypothetical protein